ncbi:protein javelin [Drosophila mojavensis]|uniref:protein javelin n=1 Tax=Drosophila mojavensis TaxID=7230 RepID=UPI001CD06EFA|nr:protein javelin [Drosophila mojavensis]
MGNGYFRTSQTSTSSRQRDKRGKDSYSYQHNYVDRVRLEDTNYQQQHQHHHQHYAHHHQKTTHDPRCPQLRAAGWRHTHKSVSHLDLATSCHGAAGAGIDHRQRQLLHHQPHHPQPPLTPHAQPHWTQCRVGIATAVGQGQLRNARSLDYTQLEREENALDIAEFYWRFDAEAPLEQVDNYAVNDNYEPAAPSPAAPSTADTADTAAATAATTATTTVTAATTTTTSTPGAGATATVTATFLDFGSESCSLRRSRSLAVIREETFSDLQIGSANSSRRRSQLIPRARLVNRGFFRESPRLHNKQQQQQQSAASEQTEPEAEDTQSNTSGATTCDSHQQQQQQLLQQQHQLQQQQQQQQQQHKHHHCPQRQRHQCDARDFDVYYDNLKRLDALALGLSEQLHPWHNDKSDLESLNSDYFKNSLHQSHSEQQQQPSSLEFEALEQAVTLLSERPRIYQSRRQQQQHRAHHHCHQQRHIDLGGESCPELSQSSVFPETTTSNSDDQTDSPSLSEQEYDLTRIEQIFQQSDSGAAEESYELISLTTTTRTRFESSEDEHGGEGDLTEAEQSLATPTETAASDSDGTLKRTHSEQLDKLIAYDSVYLSSEDSSECTLIGESCESFEKRTFTSCLESGELETRSLLHISIEDTVYEPQPKQQKKGELLESEREAKKEQEQEKEQKHKQEQPLLTTAKVEAQIYTQVLKVEQAPCSSSNINVGVTSSAASKPRILSVVEKRKLKQEELKQPAPPELKRQATDTFVVTATHKSNLVENQYHSLPDVNIGVSLKVCENIDKELRTSYNLQRQQQRKESKRQKGQSAESGEVTRAETYDSIRRFGRAHQKARQKEYEERERQRERADSTHAAKKETQQEAAAPKQSQVQKSEEAVQQEFPAPIEVEIDAEQCIEAEEQPLPPPPPPIADEELNEHHSSNEQSVNDNNNDNDNDNQSVSLSQLEQPKEAPVIEVANFSKLIERRAQEIRQRAKERPEQPEQTEQPPSFRIIVTDAQNNIIQTEAIQEEPSKSSSATAPPNSGHPSSQRSLRRASISAGGKPPERRVLSAGASIYKARPIKVLSTAGSDSFGRQKMSRPQILHVVDSSNASGAGSLRRRSSARSMASTVSNESGEVATEYLQKVDAVKCYWNRLAGNEPGTEAANKEQSSRLNFQLGTKVTPAPEGEKPAAAAGSSGDYCSIMPPSIEIVELGDGAQKATIVSAAPQERQEGVDDDEDAAQFDHIRYKVLKSQQLIRSNILTTRNKKEAQFDGLIQYLQDYSFQELLSNNNVVIVEPVRTKIERPLTVGVPASTAGAAGGTGGVPPPKPPRQNAQVATTAPKKVRQRQVGGSGAKRHFFYQPVRVNRELYEEELPDPDTVRNVRRFFEQNILPTPGQGMLVHAQQKFGGSACQLSPKSRRAHGYRYLTIDTSYGSASNGRALAEEQPKGMELLEEHKVKHWDNASLSSGISSGDLSSPCGECHHQTEALAKESPVTACKNVHVLDVVRRHNSNAANAKARAKLASRRTWCVGGAAGDSRYRQIYEHNLEQTQLEADMQDEHAGQENDNHDDDNEDDDAETDMCDTYYVSNDVLAKIRECGSTVTYYGGRVLDRGAPTTTASAAAGGAGAAMQINPPLINGNSSSATRLRVRQIESCNVCPPRESCTHEQEEQQQDSYQGIKFKLVKSNSCSSRLELAGTDEGDSLLGDSEVVRKMVHHFECSQQPPAGDGNLTINSQSTAAKRQAQHQEQATARRQVTVNNHINVLLEAVQAELSESQDVHDKQNGGAATYQSQAMNIRLDLSARRENGNANANANGNGNGSCDKPGTNSKVCRNKNVDLAYTLAKQPEVKVQHVVNPSTPTANQQTLTKLTKKPEIAAREQIIVPVQIHQPKQQQQPIGNQERRLSNASSSASIVDKTVVRHYVANDRSIYERRKYDEIEFEEFEIYDPAKDLERQQQEQQQQQQQAESSEHSEQSDQAELSRDSIDKRQTDGELYDSLDDKM